MNHIRTDSVRTAEDDTPPLYTQEEMDRCLKKIEVIDYHQVRGRCLVSAWVGQAGDGSSSLRGGQEGGPNGGCGVADTPFPKQSSQRCSSQRHGGLASNMGQTCGMLRGLVLRR
jgi:hypothetical protein